MSSAEFVQRVVKVEEWQDIKIDASLDFIHLRREVISETFIIYKLTEFTGVKLNFYAPAADEWTSQRFTAVYR